MPVAAGLLQLRPARSPIGALTHTRRSYLHGWRAGGRRAPRSTRARPRAGVISAVAKSYGTTEILRHVSLDVARGEVVVIIGPSGSGKTTLLRCVAGLEPIQGGQIHVFGTPVRNTWRLHGKVGFVFQHFNLFPQMTALENVMLALVKVRR